MFPAEVATIFTGVPAQIAAGFDAVGAAGELLVMLTALDVAEHPFASVTVKVCDENEPIVAVGLATVPLLNPLGFDQE